MIDGKQTNVHGLRTGTTLTATYTTTTTPDIDRTVSNLTGTVWFVSGNTVILTLPDGTNKMYKSLPDYKFNVDGRDNDVSSLRKGMRISAEHCERAERGSCQQYRYHRVGPQTRRGSGKGPCCHSGSGGTDTGAHTRSGPAYSNSDSRTCRSPRGCSCSGGTAHQAPQNGQHASFGWHAGPAIHWRQFRSSHGAAALKATRRA
jgi:hypothetical protein